MRALYLGGFIILQKKHLAYFNPDGFISTLLTLNHSHHILNQPFNQKSNYEMFADQTMFFFVFFFFFRKNFENNLFVCWSILLGFKLWTQIICTRPQTSDAKVGRVRLPLRPRIPRCGLVPKDVTTKAVIWSNCWVTRNLQSSFGTKWPETKKPGAIVWVNSQLLSPSVLARYASRPPR